MSIYLGKNKVNTKTPNFASGTKYIWTDIDGEGAWDVSGYQYCAVDGAPVKDFAHVRYWVNLTPATGLTVKIGYCGSSSYPIYWGDGTSSYGAYSDGATHTYDDYGKYVIESVSTNPDDPYLYFIPEAIKVDGISDRVMISPLEAIIYSEISAANRQSGLAFGGSGTTGYLYKSCPNIKKIYLDGICASGVPAIERHGLTNCASLEELIVGPGIQKIYVGYYLFRDCPNMKALRFLCQVPPTADNSYEQTYNIGSNLPTTCKIYVPTGTLSAYTSAANYPNPTTYTYVEE